MKVLEIVGSFGTGGVERNLAGRLKTRRADVQTHVIVSSHSDQHIHDYSEASSVQSVPSFNPYSWWHAISSLRPTPDVVLVHVPWVAIVLLARASNIGTPIIPIVHNYGSRGEMSFPRVQSGSLALLNPRARGHMIVSEDLRESPLLRRSPRIARTNLGSEINPWTDPDYSLWPSSSQIRFLSAGRLVRAKQFPELVREVGKAQNFLRAQSFHLLIVGSGPEEDLIRRVVTEVGVGDLVSLHQVVPDISPLLKAADAFVISSRHEGGPLTLYEAMQSGTKVLSTRVGAASEVLADDPESLVLESVSQLHQGLMELARRDQLLPLQRADRANLAERWSLEACTPNFYATVANLLDM